MLLVVLLRNCKWNIERADTGDYFHKCNIYIYKIISVIMLFFLLLIKFPWSGYYLLRLYRINVTQVPLNELFLHSTCYAVSTEAIDVKDTCSNTVYYKYDMSLWPEVCKTFVESYIICYRIYHCIVQFSNQKVLVRVHVHFHILLHNYGQFRVAK